MADEGKRMRPLTDLATRHCQACTHETPPLSTEAVSEALGQLSAWSLEDGKIVRDVKTKNFVAALELVNAAGRVAEEEGHHPDLLIHGWNHVKITLYTHSIGGLSENDFILAAKIDRLLAPTD